MNTPSKGNSNTLVHSLSFQEKGDNFSAMIKQTLQEDGNLH